MNYETAWKDLKKEIQMKINACEELLTDQFSNDSYKYVESKKIELENMMEIIKLKELVYK